MRVFGSDPLLPEDARPASGRGEYHDARTLPGSAGERRFARGTPEILGEEDPDFQASVDKFIEAVSSSEALIGREVVRRYGGFYGPTCVVDFALIPGSTSNIVNQILQTVDAPLEHKQAILSAKSWGMNTSYGVGEVFAQELEAGATLSDAIDKEVVMIQQIYENPVEAQAQLMDSLGHTSFDVRK